MIMKKHRRRSPSSQSPNSQSSGSGRAVSSSVKSISAGTACDDIGSNSASSIGGGSNRPRSLFFGGGSSKHKRRLFRKDSSTVTEACSLSSKGSVQTDGALWRVGKISFGGCRTRPFRERGRVNVSI